MPTTKRTSTFTKGETKKHSVIYECSAPDAIARSIYVSKSALPAKFPTTLTITLEHEDVA